MGTAFGIDRDGDYILPDPGADRIVFWDESADMPGYLTAGTGLSISGSNLTAPLTIGDSVTSGTANRVLFVGATGLLADDADLTFDGTTLTANTLTVSTGNLTVSAGHILRGSATQDIGASGSGWRTGYFGTSVVTPIIVPPTSTRLLAQLPSSTGNVANWLNEFVVSASTSSNAAGIALAYDTGANAGNISALEPGIAWRDLNFRANQMSFLTTGATEQVRIIHTASAVRYITLTGSVAGNPAISVSAGELAVGTNAWTFGIANSVSPTAPNRTLTVTIGATTYYIHAKTTND